ncbi:M48 family metalloprotease [Anaeromyxobacter terrae]|uniref:M48 family metalloprotease n=1 Tax=Anaeromyxobacter terrae TaxID=2925406 RepID=UPI001F578FE6|nr:M48 family metalloprotease [Anaeromyxobacter sp. SG22]
MARARAVTAWASAALVLAACAHAPRHGPRFECPARGGPPWSELATDHFIVASDLRRAQADALARELEEVRAWVVAALFPGDAPSLPGLVRVVAFRTAEEFDEFAPPGLRAYFTRSGLGEPVIVMPGDDVGPELRAVLGHEIAHQVARHVYPRQPRWFGEGLAGLAEAERDETGRAVFGPIPAHRAHGFVKRHVSVRELLAWDGRSRDGRYHDTATVLVHYLLVRQPDRFAEVRRRLARADDPPSVWREVFPEWSPDGGSPEALDRALDAHAREALLPGGERHRVEVAVSAEPIARTLSPGEVHATRLALTRFARGDAGAGAAERAEMEEALAEDPDHVVGLQVKAALDRLDPLPLARRAVAAHPDDVRAWLWLATSALREGLEGERFRALERAAEVAPASAMAANNLAWSLLLRGDAQAALPLAEKAAALSPGDPAILDTRAGVLEALGRCPEALATAERALELVPEYAPDDARAPWVERAERLRVRCGAASGLGPRAGASR